MSGAGMAAGYGCFCALSERGMRRANSIVSLAAFSGIADRPDSRSKRACAGDDMAKPVRDRWIKAPAALVSAAELRRRSGVFSVHPMSIEQSKC